MARNLFKFEFGYLGAAVSLIRAQGTYLAKGSRNWLIIGINKIVAYRGPVLQNGVEGGTQMVQAAEGYASLGTADSPGIGSVFRVLTALFFIGRGKLRYNGLSTGATATSTLSLRLLENNSYSGATLQAGMGQPSAPTIFTKAPGAGLSGTQLIAGTRAVALHRIRGTTGAKSIASLPSNVVIVKTGETIAITAPLPDSNGQDRWGIDVPLAGRGEIGPFFILREIPESDFRTTTRADGAITSGDNTLTSASSTFTAADIGRAIVVNGAGAAAANLTTTIASINSPTSIEVTDAAGTTVAAATFRHGAIVNGISRTIELEWSDGELAGADLAPIDDFPPPPAMFGGTLNDTGFLDGCYGDVGSGAAPATQGSTIVLSIPGHFESWPPDSLVYTPQPPTAVSSRGADGYAYRLGPSTMGALVYTGGDPAISFQLRWPTAGCLAPHNMVIAGDGRLYVFTPQYGLARIGEGDEPDTEWALPFSDDVQDWNPIEVVMGEDGSIKRNPFVCACHRKMVLPYNRALERAGTPCDLTGKIIGNIVSAVNATDGKLLLCTNNVRTVSDLTTTNASAIITSPTAVFTDADIGKTVRLTEAGPGVGTLETTILSRQSGTQVTLATNVTWSGAANTTIAIDVTMRLYAFDGGTGMVSEALTPWVTSDDESDHVFAVGGALTVDNIVNPVELKLLANGRTTNIARTWRKKLPSPGFNHLPTESPNLINAKSHAVYLKVTGAGGEVVLDSLQTISEPNGMVLAK